MIQEVQRIYISEGTPISNKHIEVIIGRMFNRVKISSSGSTEFIIGEIVDKSHFFEVNRKVKKAGGEPARAEEMLLGITKTSLTAEGFLAAASFQETARVLVTAASEGRYDELKGLKENVIIGRLLPIGTNYRKEFGTFVPLIEDPDMFETPIVIKTEEELAADKLLMGEEKLEGETETEIVEEEKLTEEEQF
jgi:DNA-directed RNA polymerase subunit beta'